MAAHFSEEEERVLQAAVLHGAVDGQPEGLPVGRNAVQLHLPVHIADQGRPALQRARDYSARILG